MLPQKLRIRKATAREVFIRGINVSSPTFLLKFEKVPGQPTRFAVSVSKKVASTAVLRNRTRRRVYSVIREMLPNVKPGFVAAISVKKGGETLEHAAIVSQVKGIFSKAGII